MGGKENAISLIKYQLTDGDNNKFQLHQHDSLKNFHFVLAHLGRSRRSRLRSC